MPPKDQQETDADAGAPAGTPSAAPQEPESPLARAKRVALGDTVLVCLHQPATGAPVMRPATVVAVWPGEFGNGEPPGLNLVVHLDGSNDNATLAKDTPEGLGMHQTARAVACENSHLWLTSVRYGEGARRWTLRPLPPA